MSRPTWAQVWMTEELASLIDISRDTLPLCIDEQDTRALRELIRTCRALLELLNQGDAWIESSRAFVDIGVQLVKDITFKAMTR